MRGSLNELMPLSHQQQLASYYTNHEIITVEDAGHDLTTAKFDECLAIVFNYLNEIKHSL
jgi:hypothetical protein